MQCADVSLFFHREYCLMEIIIREYCLQVSFHRATNIQFASNAMSNYWHYNRRHIYHYDATVSATFVHLQTRVKAERNPKNIRSHAKEVRGNS